MRIRNRRSSSSWISGRRASVALIVAALLPTTRFSGIQAAGVPGEFVASNQWRNLFSFHSPLTNPAFMTERNYTSLRGVFSFAPPAEAVANLWEAGVTIPLGLYQSIGATWIAEHGLPIEDGEFDETTSDYIPGSTSQKNDINLYVASYAINPWRQLSVGLNFKFLHQTGFGSPTTGIGADLGACYRVLRHPLLGSHILGFTYQNLLSSKFTSRDEVPDAAQLKLTYNSTYFENRFEFDCQFDLTDFNARASDFLNGDIQLKPAAEWRLSAQAGFWLLRFFNIKAYMGYGDGNTIQFWGLGAGINAPSLNTGRDMQVIYQFRDELAKTLSASHSLYIRTDIGNHREEIYARKMARTLDMSANALYNKALRLYFSGQYWDAYFIFTRIITGFPDFFKNDWVAYYQGACLEGMDMRRAGLEAYELAEERNVAGEVNPYSQLGRMRIYYRDGNLSAAQQVFGLLSSNLAAPDSLRHHAYYLMGQIYLAAKNFPGAIHALSFVPETHPDYAFAQHSMAICHILQSGDLQRAVEMLERSVGGITLTKAQREIVNRSYLLFGYLFYEENALAKAVSALRKVPAESFFYEDALLGLCWAAYRAGQWKDCIANGQLLANKSTNPVLQSEGMLIQAFGLLMEKNYDQARLVLEAALSGIKKYQDITEDEIERERLKYDNTRITYDQLAEEMTALAVRSELAARIKQTDSLRQVQGRTKTAIDEHISFGDRSKRSLFFGKNASHVKEDVEYALITVHTILKNRGGMKNVQRAKEEESQIDQEIERLRRQLQEER